MIEKIVIGDIISPENPRDIIIGMNQDLQDVTGIGLRFVRTVIPDIALELGSVISFDFDHSRKLHMVICHTLGKGGWANAAKHVRFGLDHLDHLNDSGRKYSIVQIGTGRIGVRDGADHATILKAMADSFLAVNLYVFEGRPMEEVIQDRVPLRALHAWNPIRGEIPMQMAA